MNLDNIEDRRMRPGEDETMYILRIGGTLGQEPHGSPYAGGSGGYSSSIGYDERTARGGNSLPTIESFLRGFVNMVEERERQKNKKT